MRQHVLITNAALDDGPDGSVILRGKIGPSDLRKLEVGPYQKKTHRAAKLKRLGQAVINGDRLPDIECGMRGQRFDTQGNNFLLYDPVYIIDGLQRKMSLTAVAARHPEIACTIGIVINFGTTETWERARFEKLATDRTNVAPSVILRNLAKDDKVARMIYGLTTDDRDCILYDRVTWDQHEMVGEIINANTLYYVITLLHGWAVAPPARRNPHAIVEHVNEIAETIGDAVMLSNTRKFFELVEYFWGFRELQKKDGPIQVRPDFLFVMSELMARIRVFWDGSMLKDGRDVRRLKNKLAINAKLKDWLTPRRAAREHVLIYYMRELNKNRSTPFAEQPMQSRRQRTREKAA